MARGAKQGHAKAGGRKKGTPNKATDETRALIERALGGSPLEKMATLAKELLDGTRVLLIPVLKREGREMVLDTEETDAKAAEIAAKLLIELGQYVAPKRKAIELTHELGDRTASTLADLMQRAASHR